MNGSGGRDVRSRTLRERSDQLIYSELSPKKVVGRRTNLSESIAASAAGRVRVADERTRVAVLAVAEEVGLTNPKVVALGPDFLACS